MNDENKIKSVGIVKEIGYVVCPDTSDEKKKVFRSKEVLKVKNVKFSVPIPQYFPLVLKYNQRLTLYPSFAL